jgi:hypothetical protein
MKSIIVYLVLIAFAATTGAELLAADLIANNPFLVG